MRKCAIFLLVLPTVLVSGHSRGGCPSATAGGPFEENAITRAMKVRVHTLAKTGSLTGQPARQENLAKLLERWEFNSA